MTRDDWAGIHQGDRLRDRDGREWTATADARDKGNEVEVWLRSGDLVRRVTQWDARDYEVVGG